MSKARFFTDDVNEISYQGSGVGDILDCDQISNQLLIASSIVVSSASVLFAVDISKQPIVPVAGLFPEITSSVADKVVCAKWTGASQAIGQFANFQTPAYFNFSAGTCTTLPSAGFFGMSKTNGMAVNIGTSTVISLGSANNTYAVYALNGGTPTIVNPHLSGTPNFQSVIRNPSNANFVFGLANGVIVEMPSNGSSVIQTVTLPAAVFTGASVGAQIPESLSMNSAGTELFVGTTAGYVLHYTGWNSSPVLSDWVLVRDGNVNVGGANQSLITLSNIVNGLMMVGDNSTSGSSDIPKKARLFDVSTSPIFEVDNIQTSGNANNPITNMLLDGVNNKATVCWQKGRVSVFNMTALTAATETTRLMNPPGVDVSGRVVRLVRYRKGLWKVDLDTAIATGSHSEPARLDDQDYVELALNGTPFSSEIFGLRRMQP